jgi:hypothetical protein
MSEPFENKWKQTRMALTNLKVRYNELDTRYNQIRAENHDLVCQVKLAANALYEAGYRRLDDMSWTNEPLEPLDE